VRDGGCAFVEKVGKSKCGAEATHEVPEYYVNGDGLLLCEKHVEPWVIRHPFGVPEPIELA
jgi:hypothetical protein